MGYNGSMAGYWGVNNGYYEFRAAQTSTAISTTAFETIKVARIDDIFTMHVNNQLVASKPKESNAGTLYLLALGSSYQNT